MPLKKAAHALVHARCEHFAAKYGVAYRRIRIGAARTRWGSCSAKGHLNFNYKLAALPPRIADYIVVHEICHLAQLNHSKAFWELVAREIPEHQVLRRELRRIVFSFR